MWLLLLLPLLLLLLLLLLPLLLLLLLPLLLLPLKNVLTTVCCKGCTKMLLPSFVCMPCHARRIFELDHAEVSQLVVGQSVQRMLS